jgi:hypothetical protein
MRVASIAAWTAAGVIVAGAAHAADLPADQKAAICGPRATCAVAAVTAAGSDDSGAKLSVVDIKLGVPDRPKDTAPDDGCFSQDENSEEKDGGHEYWLLRAGDPPRRLLKFCNDGYGAAGMGMDDVKVGKNRLTHTRDGGSSWRWEEKTTYSLSPFRALTSRDCSFHGLAPSNGTLTDTDYGRFQARAVTWRNGDSGSDDEGECPEWPEKAAFGPTPTKDLYGAWIVPEPLGDKPAPLPEGTTLGDCALRLSTDGKAGFLVYGKAAPAAAAAEARVIALGNDRLVVQVYDPTAAKETAAAAGRSWIHAPHLEIWTAEEAASENPDEPPAKAYQQVGVGLDGKVDAGAGNPVLPAATAWTAKDEQGRDVTVLQIAFPDEYALVNGVGVVYSQSDGGKQARLVGNIGVAKVKPLFLPTTWTFQSPAELESESPVPACAVKDGRVAIAR